MLLPTVSSGVALLCLFGESHASPVLRRWGLDYKPSVVIKNGTVTGAYLPTFDQDAFLGVPFAQPPVGDLRLRRPQSLNTSFPGGTYEATELSPFVSCPVNAEASICLTTSIQCPGVGSGTWSYPLSEDCLRLNIIRPTGTNEGDKLPVGYWIYGGSFQQGGNADQRREHEEIGERGCPRKTLTSDWPCRQRELHCTALR